MKPEVRFYIETFGCQMNVHDSEMMGLTLSDRGWIPVDSPEAANLIILNTCAVREKAEQKVFSRIGRLVRLKKINPGMKLVLAGCMAASWRDSVIERCPGIDAVLGPGSLERLLPNLEKIMRNADPQVDVDESKTVFSIDPSRVRPVRSLQAWVTVMEGCDNFCSYCIVPFVRGRERSRPASEIILEVEKLVSHGIREITLLGQNVNSYRGHVGGFGGLLEDIQQIKGLVRIRFTTSHPKDITQSLIRTMASLPSVCEYLHFPAQSGSNTILDKMNRKYTREDYLEKVAMIISAIPSVALSSDFIVGFPGETAAEFDQTLSLIRQVRFSSVFAFKYSIRPHTSAGRLVDDVPEEVKSGRLASLIELQRIISSEWNRQFIGKTVEVLVEGQAKRGSQRMTGRTRQNRIVNFTGIAESGRLANVRVDSISPNCLYGTLVDYQMV